MRKLNFGCGHRYAKGWINIDFHSDHPDVQRVNLLRPLPFTDNFFDAVYSSHVLEHFPRKTAETILKECWRVLKPGGILRTVVPDLENTCREYLHILDRVETSELDRRKYEWIVLELLDQLTRQCATGEMGPYLRLLQTANDQEMIRYVRGRTDTTSFSPPRSDRIGARLRRLTWNKVKTKLIYAYVEAVKHLLPAGLRPALVDDTLIGEKHKWMYDRYGLTVLLQRCGFHEITFLSAFESKIPDFDKDHLDVDPNGEIYKPISLFCEALKP